MTALELLDGEIVYRESIDPNEFDRLSEILLGFIARHPNLTSRIFYESTPSNFSGASVVENLFKATHYPPLT